VARWDPEGEARLRAAAIELFTELGYENVTVTQIADRAGLTRRTFSRYFADKRDVLFAGSDELPMVLANAVRNVNAEVPPFEATLAALVDVAEILGVRVAEHAPQRRAIIAGSPELQERGHAKFAAVADAVAAALRDRKVDAANATLLADVAVAIFRTAFDQWVDDRNRTSLASHIREVASQLRNAVTTDEDRIDPRTKLP
jgi:AcrR family transcriptional regulator